MRGLANAGRLTVVVFCRVDLPLETDVNPANGIPARLSSLISGTGDWVCELESRIRANDWGLPHPPFANYLTI